jgi:two-component system, OmpR family, sensor histidine kinase KdpD
LDGDHAMKELMNNRPDPDALLSELQDARASSGEGRLKIFLGMSPGVGKTYAMLLAGQTQQEEGVDVVIGLLETHGRVETAAVAAGLPRVARKIFEHRGVRLEEMDLDALLARKPQLALVDELAHSNAAGSRHPKRWQDVFELLQAGIDVYTTLNVQHIESYRDVVRQITGAPINETVSDEVLDRADEFELIDLTPEQLRKRLEEGKVYLGERAIAASENFFREGNLRALREIALRITAEKADRELRQFMRSRRIDGPSRSRERFLVAVGSSPFSERLIRLTRRAAVANHASWIAVHVDSGRPLDIANRTRLESNLALARSLGAEVVMTTGENIVETLLRVAKENNVSQIVVGKTLTHPFVEWLTGGSLVSKLVRKSGEIDIYVVRADKAAAPWRPEFGGLRRPAIWKELGLGALVVTATTLLGLLLQPTIGYSAVGLLYLLAVLLSATALSQIPILLTALLTAFAWNFLFIPPLFTFHIRGAHDLILFGMYFVVALVLGQLHSRLRQRERAERRREQQAVALYRFSSTLSASADFEETLRAAIARMSEIFAAEVSVFLAGSDGAVNAVPAAGNPISAHELAVAGWALAHREPAGRFTNTLPQSDGFYLPLRRPGGVVGVLAFLRPRNATLGFEEKQMLETFASQLALVIEQARLQGEAERSRLEEKSRQLQKTLLDSVSHEFKTPLAVIGTAVDRLKTRPAEARPMLEEISTAVARLERVVGNLLDITRIETGAVRPQFAWCDLHEIVDAAISRVADDIGTREIEQALSADAATLRVDPGLLEEILVNLLRNASQHSGPESTIRIAARGGLEGVTIVVVDEGVGLSEEIAGRLFEKFERGTQSLPGGLGLGLSIVRGFAEALGGRVTAGARRDGKQGAEFSLLLPVATQPASALETKA